MPSRIGDYSGTTSSPVERDFAMLNLLICGNPPAADLRPRQSLNLGRIKSIGFMNKLSLTVQNYNREVIHVRK